MSGAGVHDLSGWLYVCVLSVLFYIVGSIVYSLAIRRMLLFEFEVTHIDAIKFSCIVLRYLYSELG